MEDKRIRWKIRGYDRKGEDKMEEESRMDQN